jgi:phage tail P2-like protein
MLKETAPPNLLKDPIIKALLESADPELQKVKEQIINAIIYPRIDEIDDEELLDLLAWQFHVEGYDLAKTVEEKRNLVKNAIELHRYKGTKYAVKKVLSSLNLNGEVKEWFEYNGQPYRFKIELGISNREITTELKDKLIKLVNEYKNERSWLDEILLSYLAQTQINLALGQAGETESFSKCQTDLIWEASGQMAFAVSPIAETEAASVMEV